ncbi:hypothetical protein GQX74_011002 [Glossina fuscipes]|nr:hypothetical protein GQX74_011002 [Glossina fuscipes]
MAKDMTAIRRDTSSNQCESAFESFVEKCMDIIQEIPDNMHKYQQLLLLIIFCISVICILMYKTENNRLKYVLHNLSSPYDELTIIPAGFDVTRLNTYRKKLIGIVKKQCVGIMQTSLSVEPISYLFYGTTL